MNTTDTSKVLFLGPWSSVPGACDRLGPAVDSQFRENVTEVLLHRVEGEDQPGGNLLVGAPGLDQRQNLQLSLA